MAKKKSSKSTTSPASSIGSLSTGDLQAELRRRQAGLARLERKRDRLMHQLAEVEAELQEAGGTVAAVPGRRRARNEQTLPDAIADVLDGYEMGVTEVAEAVQEAGYVTTAANFRTIVNQTLIRDKRFKKVSRGIYTLK